MKRTGYERSGLPLVRGFCDLLGWRVHAALTRSAELEIRIAFDPITDTRVTDRR